MTRGPWLVAISDEFVAALANAGDDEISAVTRPWSETEEFGGQADVAELNSVLRKLRDLTARTVERGRPSLLPDIPLTARRRRQSRRYASPIFVDVDRHPRR
ncbi:hypothetical protein [Herbidospora cretacea]|uniref:hypothetical protein n=1 Tax=Herbidospora cretacea TaxID=28444 RepID=UPI0004C2D395|nr:hypothetical protein [Herbidospora cretacea]